MTRFLLDSMCGGLRAYLRLCGHDAAYALDRDVESDDAVAALARDEDRVVVTRDRQLAARVDGVLLTEREVPDQLRELAAGGVALEPTDEPERCGRCNAELDAVDADATTPEYGPDPAETPVWRCRDCGQCFWRGSHYERMVATLEDARAAVGG